jgi:hypothetical protein
MNVSAMTAATNAAPCWSPIRIEISGRNVRDDLSIGQKTPGRRGRAGAPKQGACRAAHEVERRLDTQCDAYATDSYHVDVKRSVS